MSKVLNMADWTKLKNEPEQATNDDLVTMLSFLLEEARAGNLVGFTGAFLLNDDDDGPSVGMVASHVMADTKYLTIGALEKIKAGLLK